MRALNVFLSIAISLLIALLVFEGGLRLFPQFRPTTSINEFDADLGWSKRPNAEVGRSAGPIDITIRTNAEGLRDDQSPTKPDSTFRVVMLGDSFTLGYTVEREEAFADLCEQWWQAEGRRVEVINAGTEGWATDQEVAWFLKHGAKYEPDLVLLFPYDNDIYWCGEESYVGTPKPRFTADGTLEARTLVDPGEKSCFEKTAIGKFVAGPKGPEEKDYFSPGTPPRRVFREFAPLLTGVDDGLGDAIARTKGALRALKTRCDELGAGLVVVPIPSEMVVHEDQRKRFDGMFGDLSWNPERPLDLFAGMTRELGITALDARKDLVIAGKDERLYFDDGEWHFNVAGNRFFASYLVSNLDALGVFPSDHSAITEGKFDDLDAGAGGGLPTWLKLYAALALILGTIYKGTYPEENTALAYLKIAAFLALIFTIFTGAGRLSAMLPPKLAMPAIFTFVVCILGFVAYKLGRRLATIVELLKAFTLRGHWYLMPLVVVLLTIGSLLVVAASSPLLAPFIYTLF